MESLESLAASCAAYASHWDGMFEKETSPREWHCGYETIKAVLSHYLAHASSFSSASLLDIGCGTSGLGLDVYRDEAFSFKKLMLLDASTLVVDKLMRSGFDGKVEVVCADCRDLPFLADGSISAILDKGTCDALNNDDDKRRMIQESLRVLETTGVLASVSFSSVARLHLLKSMKGVVMVDPEDRRAGSDKDLEGSEGFKLRVYLIGKGDPARGKECRFLSLISRDFGPVPYSPDELTVKVLKRIEKAGSLTQGDDLNITSLFPFD